MGSVFIAISPQNRNWYLRFFADWDEHDTNLIGEYSIALAQTHVDLFRAEVVSTLKCQTVCEDVFELNAFKVCEPPDGRACYQMELNKSGSVPEMISGR